MKLHALFIAGLASVLLLSGCSGQPAQPMPDKHKSITKVTAPSDKAVALVQPQSSAKPASPAVSQNIQRVEIVQPQKTAPVAPKLIKISGIGYGAESAYENVTRGQRRLMAIRASKLDAYRSLAEQLYGIKIDSNTSISTLTAKSDSFRARVNAVVRGARVVSVTPLADRNYETVLEVYIDQGFFNNTFVYTNCPGGDCSTPVPASNLCQGVNCDAVSLGLR